MLLRVVVMSVAFLRARTLPFAWRLPAVRAWCVSVDGRCTVVCLMMLSWLGVPPHVTCVSRLSKKSCLVD